MLHGFCGSADTFAEVRTALGSGYACEAPAILGHGGGLDATRFEDEVDRLAGILGVGEPPLLLGYSFGGRLAMGLVARHPERWRGAVFVGAHPGLADPLARADRRGADRRWIDLLAAGDLDAFIIAWEAQPIFASQANIDATRRARQRAERACQDPRALARATEVLGLGAMPCWEDALAAARLPMVFVAGALDPKYVTVGEALAARAPALRLVVVPGAGHNVVFEAPEAVAAVVRDLAAGDAR
jgi:2-succinyl-6-hydroxy-2,4-cyclohexadiene-1-carboxylate synthase